MKTFEEWREHQQKTSVFRDRAYAAWQACAAEYQPQLESMTHAAHKFSDMWRESQENRRELAAIIDEARKLGEAWKNDSIDRYYAELLLAALDRSGARGGSQ